MTQKHFWEFDSQSFRDKKYPLGTWQLEIAQLASDILSQGLVYTMICQIKRQRPFAGFSL